MSEDKYFSQEKKDKLLNWLKEKWPENKRKCDICDSSQWTVADDLVMPMPFVGGPLTLGGSQYPQVMLICTSCGNTKYINAVLANVIPSKRQEGENNGQ